jgi:hypothetical protein
MGTTYNPDGWTEKEVNAGAISETEVSEIKNGVLKDFVKDWSTFDKAGTANPEQTAILVKTGAGASMLISLPEGKTYHPNSKLGKWIKTYKKAPYKGQKVKVMTDENGFNNILLSK